MRLQIVDVFAERQFEGNQLAVVHDAATLSTEAMQTIAREMNFSETTFVTGERDGASIVRIFTPTAELPFAGHPTLGTAWALTGGEGTITLALAAGEVPVRFESGVGWMTPPATQLGDTIAPDAAAALVSLAPSAVHPTLPAQHAQVGPSFVFVPVARLADLRAARLDVQRFEAARADGEGVSCVCVFSPESYDDHSDYAMRVFFDAGGIREDPATGSANTAFAAYLRAHLGALGAVTVAQGVEINRPSRLYLKVADPIEVGGRVFPSVDGQLC
ncbi:MAG: PhzF family phenazine biosynthesis protein [Pseudomonadota bacterium]